MDDLIKQLRAELEHVKRERDGWKLQIGKVAALVPIPEIIAVTGTTGDLINWLKERVAASYADAAALTEAQATIARQQVMLDRALEDVGAKMVEIGRLRGKNQAIGQAVHLMFDTGTFEINRLTEALRTIAEGRHHMPATKFARAVLNNQEKEPEE